MVASWTRAYAADPRPENLVSFPRRDSTHWRSASWRDSDAGYAGGRFAMDINAIWAPEALEAIGRIVGALPGLGLGPTELDTASLRQAVETWRGARRHFEVILPPSEVERRVKARLAALPADEAAYWNRVRGGPVRDTLRFLALALDSAGRPIPVVNTDPATGLFLDPEHYGAAEDLSPVVRRYPEGLFVAGLGPLVANDAFAAPEVWQRFEQDRYHSPRVVWGREVNLLLLGLAGRIARDPTDAEPVPRGAPHASAPRWTARVSAITSCGAMILSGVGCGRCATAPARTCSCGTAPTSRSNSPFRAWRQRHDGRGSSRLGRSAAGVRRVRRQGPGRRGS